MTSKKYEIEFYYFLRKLLCYDEMYRKIKLCKRKIPKFTKEDFLVNGI
ncbi:MAG: hypothetical protein ABH864_05165 [archaeon]